MRLRTGRFIEISCAHCSSTDLGKAGKSVKGVQRYFCKNDDCETHTFMLEYCYKACEVGIKEKIIDMATNASGIKGHGKSAWYR